MGGVRRKVGKRRAKNGKLFSGLCLKERVLFYVKGRRKENKKGEGENIEEGSLREG